MFKVMRGERGVSHVQVDWRGAIFKVRGSSRVQGDQRTDEGRQPCSR